MFSQIRRRIVTFANVAMTLALVFAMTGGAYAAKKYLITSTKQIKPSVLAQLKGKNGKNGTDGAAGAQGPKGESGPAGTNGTNGTNGKDGVTGPNGAVGPTGPKGPTGPIGPTGQTGFTDTLPSGKTETGVLTLHDMSFPAGDKPFLALSFAIPLKTEVEESKVVYVHSTETPSSTSPCKGGTFVAPVAAKGYVCVYEISKENLNMTTVPTGTSPNVVISFTSGVVLQGYVPAAGEGEVNATWAVTAE